MSRPRLRIPALMLLALSTLGIWGLPRATGSAYPTDYRAGFPGLDPSPAARSFPAVAETSFYALPLLSSLASWHQQLLQHTSKHFVGLRQEEHRMFFELMAFKGKRLGRLVAEGALPASMHVALDCVGAIPYYSDLQVLDRLGLTDVKTGHSPYVRAELSAHGKYATLEYANRIGVDFWALHPTILLWEEGQAGFQQLLDSSRAQGQEFGIAEVEPGLFLLAWLPQGLDEARRSWPDLDLGSTLDKH